MNIPTSLSINFALTKGGCEVSATRNITEVQLRPDHGAFSGWITLQRSESFDCIIIPNMTEAFMTGTLIGVSASINESREDVKPIVWKSVRKTAMGISVLEAGDSPSAPAVQVLSIDYTPPWPLILEAVAPGLLLASAAKRWSSADRLGVQAPARSSSRPPAASCGLTLLLFSAAAVGHTRLPAGARDAFLPAVRAAILIFFCSRSVHCNAVAGSCRPRFSVRRPHRPHRAGCRNLPRPISAHRRSSLGHACCPCRRQQFCRGPPPALAPRCGCRARRHRVV